MKNPKPFHGHLLTFSKCSWSYRPLFVEKDLQRLSIELLQTCLLHCCFIPARLFLFFANTVYFILCQADIGITNPLIAAAIDPTLTDIGRTIPGRECINLGNEQFALLKRDDLDGGPDRRADLAAALQELVSSSLRIEVRNPLKAFSSDNPTTIMPPPVLAKALSDSKIALPTPSLTSTV